METAFTPLMWLQVPFGNSGLPLVGGGRVSPQLRLRQKEDKSKRKEGICGRLVN